MAAPHLPRRKRLALWVEGLFMMRLVPFDHPGPLFARLFRLPLLFYCPGVPLAGRVNRCA